MPIPNVILRRYVVPEIKRSCRSNQPTGYNPSVPGYAPVKRYRCNDGNNYDYYPVDWIDYSTGKAFKKGFYDQYGGYFSMIPSAEAMEEIKSDNYYDVNTYQACDTQAGGQLTSWYLATVTCGGCGDVVNLRWRPSANPFCPHCGVGLTGVTPQGQEN